MAGGDVDHMGRLVAAAIPSNHLAEELASHEHSLVSAVLLLAFLRLFRELLTALLFTLRARERLARRLRRFALLSEDLLGSRSSSGV